MAKKCLILVCLFVVLGMHSIFASGLSDGFEITGKEYNPRVEYKKVSRQPDARWRERDNYLYLNKELPVCGVDEAGIYFLDLTSCNYYIEDGVAYVSCIVYAGSGGADAYGNPGKIAKSTYRFSSYKTSDGRHIRLLSCVDKNGRNVTEREFSFDNGFLIATFWRAADKVGISQYLD